MLSWEYFGGNELIKVRALGPIMLNCFHGKIKFDYRKILIKLHIKNVKLGNPKNLIGSIVLVILNLEQMILFQRI